MKSRTVLVGLCVAILATAGIAAQDGFQFVAVQKKKKKLRGRLPNYYGKIGIKRQQRAKIYEIQKTYREKLEPLQDQIDELKTKQKAEVEAVLTEAQKKKLAVLVEAARKKREARKKKREDDKEKEQG